METPLGVSVKVFPDKKQDPRQIWTTQSHGLRFQTKHKGRRKQASREAYQSTTSMTGCRFPPCLTSPALREPKYMLVAEVAFVGCFATAGVLEGSAWV